MTLPVEVVKGKAKPGRLSATSLYAYSPSEITLYGIVLSTIDACVGTLRLSFDIHIGIQTQGTPDGYISALIYAFAYQGHCYNLPEPVILMVNGEGKPAEGFDFDRRERTAAGGIVNRTDYKMWKVEKLDRSVQFEMTSDTFEDIILKRALAGSKQPMSYASHAQLSHRGGKLTAE